MMKKIGVFAILLFCLFTSSAQETAYILDWNSAQADSAKLALRQSGNDTFRMKTARSLGLYYQEINRDTSLFYTRMQMMLAQKLKQPFWEADAYDSGGWLLSQLKNYPLSIEYLLKGLAMVNDKNTEKNIWSLSMFSRKLDPAYARLTTLGFIHNDLSQLYHQTGDTETELSEIRLGIDVARSIGNETLLGLLQSNLAQVYVQKNQPDSVIYYGQQSLAHMKKSGYITYEGYQLTLLGDAYLQKKDYPTAKLYLDQSILANNRNRSDIKLPDAYFSYATMYEQLGKPDSVKLYLHKALDAFSFFNQPEKVNRAYGSLYGLFRKLGRGDSAYHYLQLYQSLSDSLTEQEKKQIHSSQNFAFNKQIEQQNQESERIEKANSSRTYAFVAGIAGLLLIAFLLFRNNRSRRKANMQLQMQNLEIEEQKATVENALAELKLTQAQLIQSEKMASLGELTAGIAHEIQNPLNFVNNFSELSNELLVEMQDELNKGAFEEAKGIALDVQQNLEKINHHGKRADAIVKGMLLHSQSGKAVKEPTDINKLADEYLRLAYHGLRAKDKSFNATLKTSFDESIGNINIISQDMGRVILNLITNAFYAVAEKKTASAKAADLAASPAYDPTVSIGTKKLMNSIQISVTDNGNGIPSSIKEKIFQPFFTTKPTGQGTGLGLSLAYDIVKAHGGELTVDTTVGEGTTFYIKLPNTI